RRSYPHTLQRRFHHHSTVLPRRGSMSSDIQKTPKNAVSAANAPHRGSNGSTPRPDTGVKLNGRTLAPTKLRPGVTSAPAGAIGASDLHSSAEYGQPNLCTSGPGPCVRAVASSTSRSQYRTSVDLFETSGHKCASERCGTK